MSSSKIVYTLAMGVSTKVITAVLACLVLASWQLPTLAQAGSPEEPAFQKTEQGSKENPQAVFMCGTGPSPYYENIVDILMDVLKARGVIVTNSGDTFGRGTCLEKTKTASAASLLYLVAIVSERNAKETNLSIQCFNQDGKKLWEEQERGPFMSKSVSSTIKGIAEKMSKKLRARIGEPGIPVATK